MPLMDGGLFISWVTEVALISFAGSFMLHVLLGRVAVWSVLATALPPPLVSLVVQLAPSHSKGLWELVAAMVGIGTLGGLIGASVGALLGNFARRFVAAFGD